MQTKQQIKWLQSYTLQVIKDGVDSVMTVEKNRTDIVVILNSKVWGSENETIHDILFDDGTIAPGVYIVLFEIADKIHVAGTDIPDELRCPNECNGGDVCVDTKTGQCKVCGQFFEICPTEITYTV